MELTLDDSNASPLPNLHHRAALHVPVALSVLNSTPAGLLHRPLLQPLALSMTRTQILSMARLRAPLLSMHILRCRRSQLQKILKMMSSSLGVNPKKNLMCAPNAVGDSLRGPTCGGMTRSIPERNRFPAVFLVVVLHLSKYVPPLIPGCTTNPSSSSRQRLEYTVESTQAKNLSNVNSLAVRNRSPTLLLLVGIAAHMERITTRGFALWLGASEPLLEKMPC